MSRSVLSIVALSLIGLLGISLVTPAAAMSRPSNDPAMISPMATMVQFSEHRMDKTRVDMPSFITMAGVGLGFSSLITYVSFDYLARAYTGNLYPYFGMAFNAIAGTWLGSAMESNTIPKGFEPGVAGMAFGTGLTFAMVSANVMGVTFAADPMMASSYMLGSTALFLLSYSAGYGLSYLMGDDLSPSY